MNELFSIVPLDINNKFHLAFTYSLKKDAYASSVVYERKSKAPSFDQHVSVLCKKSFYCYYLLKCQNIFFGEYIVDASFNFSQYMKQSRLKRISKKFNDLERPLSGQCFKLLLEKHPEMPALTASINLLNTLAIRLAVKYGFNEIKLNKNIGFFIRR